MDLKQASGDLSAPDGEGWSGVESAEVTLAPIPLDAQPNDYIKNAWADRSYGSVAQASVSAAHNGDRAFVRITWDDPSDEHSEFHDAAGVYFAAGDSPAATIGDESSPVELWYWQANVDDAKGLVATGPGRFRPNGSDVEASASLTEGRWSIVLSGGLDDLGSGLGVAIWNGTNEERAGIGSATAEWVSLDIER